MDLGRIVTVGQPRRSSRPATAAVAAGIAAAAAVAWAACPARAALVVRVLDSAAPAGGTGTFDVVLEDTGGTFDVAGFSFELGVPPASDVAFSAVDAATGPEPYLFGTYQSAPAPFSFDTFPATQFTASDGDLTAPYAVTLNPGDTYGLGHVTYTVGSAAAPGNVAVTLMDVGGGTSLSDTDGNAVAFTPADGTIAVVAVPEPAALAVLIGPAAAAVATRRRRRR